MSSLAHVAFEGASDKTRSTIQKAFSKNNVHTSPTVVELDSMPIGVDAHYTGPISKPADVVTHDTVKGFERAGLTYGETNSPISHKPLSPNELELSRPPSPQLDESTAVVQTWNSPWMNRWRLLSACLICFGNGCNDSGKIYTIPAASFDSNTPSSRRVDPLCGAKLQRGLRRRLIDLRFKRHRLHTRGILHSRLGQSIRASKDSHALRSCIGARFCSLGDCTAVSRLRRLVSISIKFKGGSVDTQLVSSSSVWHKQRTWL